MDTMESWCHSQAQELTEEQVTAARYLESRGKRFMVDFGTENAVKLADQLFQKECEQVLRS